MTVRDVSVHGAPGGPAAGCGMSDSRVPGPGAFGHEALGAGVPAHGAPGREDSGAEAPGPGASGPVPSAREVLASVQEADLIARARDGDLAAFEALYRAHVGRVFAASLRMSGNRDRAEEITQDVFVRLWKNLRTFEGRSSLSTWLHRLTVNRVRDMFRAGMARSGASEVSGHLDEGLPGAARVPVVDEGAGEGGVDVRSDRARLLESEICRLPHGARMVFVLHDIECYRHEEIGEMVGIATGTSKAQLHRARRLLRDRLGKRLG